MYSPKTSVIAVPRFPRWRQKRLQRLATTGLIPKNSPDVLINPKLPKLLAQKPQLSTAELSFNTHLLSWILYAPKKATLDIKALLSGKQLETTEDFNRKYRALPRWTPEQFTERLATREAAGLQLPKHQRQQLEQFYKLLERLPLA